MNIITIEGDEKDMPKTFSDFARMCENREPLELLGRKYFVVHLSMADPFATGFDSMHQIPRFKVTLTD